MKSIAPKLKAVRLRARPKVSIRAMGDALHMAPSSYAFYESPTTYKKASLPIDFARRVAAVLSEYGVEPADVMALAGLTDDEAAPEVEAINSCVPPVQYVQMAVAMPSANALQEMFDILLRGFPDELPDEAARRVLAQGLARRLPIALAQLQGPLFEMDEDESSVPASVAPPRATGRRAPPSQPRS